MNEIDLKKERDDFKEKFKADHDFNDDHVGWLAKSPNGEYLASTTNSYFNYWLARAQKEHENNTWQPIETAPKDGTPILVFYVNSNGKGRAVKAQYTEKFTEEICFSDCYEGDYNEEEDCFYLEEGWYELIDNHDEYSSWRLNESNIPTHWMPLPKFPL